MSKAQGHWVIALAVILGVAALAISQIDRHMLGFDATASLSFAGWLAESRAS